MNTPHQLTFDWSDIPSPKQPNKYFYLSDQWIKLRYRTLKRYGNICMVCGHTWSVGNPLQVDHILPRSEFPELELDPENLQVMCRNCNGAKAATDHTDWRPAADDDITQALY